jgi:hypothetical protein
VAGGVCEALPRPLPDQGSVGQLDVRGAPRQGAGLLPRQGQHEFLEEVTAEPRRV